MTTLHIFVEQFPNTDIREFHLSVPLSSKVWKQYDSNAKMPKAVSRLQKTLISIPQTNEHISFSNVGRKCIRVELNKAFSWDEVIEAVVNVLRKFYKKYHKITDVKVTIQEREAWMDKPARDDDIY